MARLKCFSDQISPKNGLISISIFFSFFSKQVLKGRKSILWLVNAFVISSSKPKPEAYHFQLSGMLNQLEIRLYIRMFLRSINSDSLLPCQINDRLSLWSARKGISLPHHEKTCLPIRSDTNRAIQPQKMARGLKFQI